MKEDTIIHIVLREQVSKFDIEKIISTAEIFNVNMHRLENFGIISGTVRDVEICKNLLKDYPIISIEVDEVKTI